MEPDRISTEAIRKDILQETWICTGNIAGHRARQVTNTKQLDKLDIYQGHWIKQEIFKHFRFLSILIQQFSHMYALLKNVCAHDKLVMNLLIK